MFVIAPPPLMWGLHLIIPTITDELMLFSEVFSGFSGHLDDKVATK
jgi:hypothetical protein